MSTPNVPLRFDLAIEVPGTPQQVWEAIATTDGITSWFMPTEVEEREGGEIRLHMGPDVESAGTVTGWEPPHRFAIVEPDWAALAGHEGADVTPLATEFLIEARSGGTCVVRVVSSAFGTGADWEREFFADMEWGWTPFFEHLRLYLTHFPGQRATQLSAATKAPGDAARLYAAMLSNLGVTEVGQMVDLRGITGRVDRIGEQALLVHLSGPVAGYLACYAYDSGEGTATAQVTGYLFDEDAASYVEREQPAWQAWLDGLAAPTGRRW